MFDMSWGEVLVIGAVALIVIGPKDLPKALRTVGNATAKLRRMAGEFQSQFNDAMREAELDELRRQVETANQQVASFSQTSFNPVQTARDEIKSSIEAPHPTAPVAEVPPPKPTASESATLVLPASPDPAHPGAGSGEPPALGDKRGAAAA